MAQGLLRNINDKDYESFSAGTHPTSVNPGAIQAMNEIGIDISDHKSQSVAEFLDGRIDIVVTVCDNAKQNCPIFTGDVQRITWSFFDPAEAKGGDEEVMDVFRRVRDEIKDSIEKQFAKA